MIPLPPVTRRLPASQGVDHSGRRIAKAALADIAMRDFNRALTRLNERIATHPNDWAALRIRAMTKSRLGDPSGAQRDASRAITLNPEDAWSYKTRAQALATLGRLDAARADTERALDLNPLDADAFRVRALIWEKLGEPERSERNISG